jgi:hypothetical protein
MSGINKNNIVIKSMDIGIIYKEEILLSEERNGVYRKYYWYYNMLSIGEIFRIRRDIMNNCYIWRIK